MAGTILIDTNVLLDDLMMREPHLEDSRRLIEVCRKGIVQGYVSANSFPDMYYIMRKLYPDDIRRKLLKAVSRMFHIVGLDGAKITAAIEDADFTDFEDCLQEKCALSVDADYIVTWNVKDFHASKIPVLTPTEFLKMVL